MMNFGKYLFGFRPEFLTKVEDDVKKSQFFSFNALSLMLLTLTVISFLAGYIYGVIVFQNLVIAVLAGFIFSAIAFLLLLLTLFLNMTTQHKDLYNKMTDMDSVFVEFKKVDFKNISDEQAMKQVTDYTMGLRDKNQIPDDKVVYGSGIIVSGIKLLLIFILSIIVANGLEMLIFHQKINESMHQINQSALLREQLIYLTDDNE